MKNKGQFFFSVCTILMGSGLPAAFSQNVGIGTLSPQFTLDIRGPNADDAGLLQVANADASHKLLFFPGRANDANPFIQWTAGDPLRFTTTEGGFKELVRIAGNGNVGIGLVNPSQKLHIAGNARIDGLLGINTISNTTSLAVKGAPGVNDLVYANDQNGVFRFNVSSAGRVGVNQAFSNVSFNVRAAVANERIFNVVNSVGSTSLFSVGPAGEVLAANDMKISGRLAAGGAGYSRPLSVKANGSGDLLSLNNGSDATKWHVKLSGAGSGDLNFVETGVAENRLYLSAGGNIGIGTATPTRKLHIETETSQVYIRRSNATGSDNQPGAYPLFVDGGRQGILVKLEDDYINTNNNFISFWGKDNVVKGRIEGIQSEDYSPPNPLTSPGAFICYVNDLLGPIPLDPLSVLTAAASIAIAVDCIDNGVTYASGFGDYAEYLEMEDPSQKMTFGDIVGVKGGKISKNTAGAEQIMAISLAPIVLGNAPPHDSLAYRYQKVAFMGQVPVKLSGPVSSGDFIIASGNGDGIGRAVAPESIALDDIPNILGRSWETSLVETPRFVKVVVGLKGNETAGIMKGYQAKMADVENSLSMLEDLKNENQALKNDMAKLAALVNEKLLAIEEKIDVAGDPTAISTVSLATNEQ